MKSPSFLLNLSLLISLVNKTALKNLHSSHKKRRYKEIYVSFSSSYVVK